MADDQLRCHRKDGRNWRCKRPSLPGKLLCESHYNRGRLTNTQSPAAPASASAPAPAAPAPAPGPGPAVSKEEIRVPRREHLDRKTKRKHSWAIEIVDAYCPDTKETKTTKKRRRRRRKKEDNDEAVIDSQDKDKEEEEEEEEKEEEVEVTTDLPLGRMAVSPPKAQPTHNPSPPVKLGLNPPNCRLVNPKIRTKNIDPPPIATIKAVPYADNLRDTPQTATALAPKRKCHWCKRTGVSSIKCLTCKKISFCSDCIKERCIDAKEIEKRCIVCRETCDCNSCKTKCSKKASSKESSKTQKKVSDRPSLHYLITLVLPILERINEEQKTEIEMEGKLKGKITSEIEIGQIETGLKEQISCNKCSSYILDMHRSCPSCSYKLCLSCCQESRSLISWDTKHTSKKKSVAGSKAHTKKKEKNKSGQNDGNLNSDNIFCPSLEIGGCGRSALNLRCVFPLKYTTELEKSAKEIILSKDSPQSIDTTLHCSLCSAIAQEGSNKKELLEASRRKHPGDNFLYSPSIRDGHETLLVHFQKHWRNSHPVVVRDLLENSCSVTWDPIALFSDYLTCISSSENDKEKTDDSISMDLFEVEFSTNNSFSGSFLKTVHSSCETLKLKAKISSALSRRVFADHYAEFIDTLPFQEYTNPDSGILNLAAKSAEDSKVSEFSPHLYIACGSAEEIQRGGLVTELRISSHDLVNILVHASDFSWSSDQINKIKSLFRTKSGKSIGGFDERVTKYSEGIEEAGRAVRNEDDRVGAPRTSAANPPGSETQSDSSVICSGVRGSSEKNIAGDKCLVDPTTEPSRQSGNERPSGAQWDVFRRQDAPKLMEYIQKHSDEFYNPNESTKQITDPFLMGNFFLDSAHKMKLKDEYKIEPWTFTQKLGEAVLIPAGCPYQMRNLESCVNVVLGFISPENAGASIKLTNKLQALSADNKPEASKLEVQKMLTKKISEAIKELHCEAIN